MTADSAQFAGKAVATDDLDLVHATQDGDISVFEQLVERYDLAPVYWRGSLLSLLRWWLDGGAKEPPGQMDELFHRMVWNVLY